MVEFTEQNREELMKCEFVYRWNSGEKQPAKLLDIEPEVGITIANRDESDNLLFCLVGDIEKGKPSTPKDKALFSEIFKTVVTQIKAGVVYSTVLNDIASSFGVFMASNPTSNFCAFSR